MDIEAVSNDAKKRLDDLKVHFMNKHLANPLVSPEEMELDAESYCVLCHAALEDYAEQISLFFIDKIEDKLSNHQEFSWGTLCALHNIDAENYDKNFEEESNIIPFVVSHDIFSYMLDKIKKAKTDRSRYAKLLNHGVDVKYLYKLFVPMGLDIPREIKLLESLHKLANYRGGCAHTKGQAIAQQSSPKDLVDIVDDTYSLLSRIKDQANSMQFYLK